MNAFIKNSLKIAGVSILLGLMLAVVAFSMDNTVFDNWENFNISMGDNNIHPGFWSDRADSKAWEEDDSFSGNEGSFEDIKSLSLDISYGTVTIKEGDSFGIDVENIPEDELNSTVKDGVWEINDNTDNAGNDSKITIFGINIINNNSHPFKAADIKLTVPEDFVFENLDIILDAGTIKADSLISDKADIDVGAGSLRINELTAREKSSYSIDTGELIIDELNANDAKINCGVGNLTASGIITGDSYVTNGIGNVELDIDGDEADYNYSVDCGIGTVIINDNSYSGVNSKTKKNNNAENSFTLDCGIGKIALKIN
ncbi:MAG: DUF4097 family beta strand repeat-containing protein [Anaerocolumna sp.]